MVCGDPNWRRLVAEGAARYIVCNRNFAIQETPVSQPASKRRIYLDHAATTPIRPEALAAMQDGFALWANPSSPHAEGRKAKQALEDARVRVKAALDWDGEVIFTSGASEAAALAYDGSTCLDEVSTSVEHDCIYGIASQRGDTITGVGADGAVDLAALERNVRQRADQIKPSVNYEDRSLVFLQHVNSETGNRQDIDAARSVISEHRALLLSDCAQSAGKLAIPHSADMVILSAHKFGGPIGVGALLVTDFAMLIPHGGHERGYRRGTENLPSILGMVAALEASGDSYLQQGVAEADSALADAVRDAGGVWFADRLSDPTPLIRAIGHPSLSGQAQLMRLDLAGISVSQGSACSSGTMKSSHVLTAMGVEDELAGRTIRISYGWNTAPQDVERFADAWVGLAS